MANITLSIEDALLQAARVRAVKEGTSVNEICRQAIEAYARHRGDRGARYRELQAQIDSTRGGKRKPLPPIGRDELYRQLLADRSKKR